MRLRALASAALLAAAPVVAFQAPSAPAPTAEQDHRQMLAQLGIEELRPGRSGFPGQPNPANYDEVKANPYPDWPALLQTEAGRPVTSADQWWRVRRPELVELFEREVVGRVPPDVPPVRWVRIAEGREQLGGVAAVTRRLQGRVDNRAYPAIEVTLDMKLILPERRSGRVPVLIMFGRPDRPAPAPPAGGDPPSVEQLVAAGWGVAILDPATIQADNGAGLTRGIIGLVNKGRPRKPDDWGALRAWGWGASRALDHLAALPEIDRDKIGIEGVSRFGKAALVTAAFDRRFRMALIASSGEGGVKPHRRDFGEAVENLTSSGQYHWMAGNFLKYGAERGRFGRKDAGDIPVESHQLLALVAPRLAFVSYGIPEQGDALWLDQQGSYMATVAAGPAWRLLGARDLGVREDHRTARMPPVNAPLLDGQLAWRQHDGGHTSQPNMKWFIAWADKRMGRPRAAGSPELPSFEPGHLRRSPARR